MKKYLLELFEQTGDLAPEDIILHLVMAAIIGALIFLSYRLSHNGSVYSAKFNVSLVVMTVLTTTVMTVIGNNIALSLGMVGALSIVRFRTAIKDSRDTLYIFWTVIVGICCGVGDYLVAAAGSGMAFLVLLLFGRIKNDDRILLVIRCARQSEEKVESVIFQYFDGNAELKVENTTPQSSELIYELRRRVLNKAVAAQPKRIADLVYEVDGVEYFNIVTQNDNISG